MSAQIPDTLLVSEVLKPTGFDCPEDLVDVSFNEAISGGTSAELEDNKEVTITENGTIEITPTAGHDYAGMKKVTAAVNVAGGKRFYIYHYEQGSDSLLCESSSFGDITVGMKGVLSSGASEYMTGVTCTEKTPEGAIFRNDTYSIRIDPSDIPTSLDSILS